MTSEPLQVDVLLRSLADGWRAMAVGTPSTEAAGDTATEALQRLERRIDPSTFEPISYRAEPPELTQVDVSVTRLDGGRRVDCDLVLPVVLTDQSGGISCAIPGLGRAWWSPDRAELEAGCQSAIEGAELADLSVAAIDPGGGPAPELERIEVTRTERDAEEASSPLGQVADPLHRQLDHRDAPGAFERDEAVDRLFTLLRERRHLGVLLVGEHGVGKTAVIEEATKRLNAGEGPEELLDRPIWRLRASRLANRVEAAADEADYLRRLFDRLETAGAILAVDNLAELADALGDRMGAIHSRLESGAISFVSEIRPAKRTTVEENAPTWLGDLRALRVEPMQPPATSEVLERLSFRLGRTQGVRLAEGAREKIIDLVERFRTTARLPGPAVELAERMVRTHRQRAADVEGRAKPELPASAAVATFSDATGLPAPLLDPSLDFELADVRSFFERAIVGQPEVIDAMVDLVAVLRAGLSPPGRPMASWVFVGPTGVGKTQTARRLAAYLFGDERRLLRFDMSEYQDRSSAGRLTGRRRGEAGTLVRRLREEPYCVLLLDEIEKAHRSVFDLLLQVMDAGRLTDARGQVASAENAVLVMTSNLGGDGSPAEAVRRHFRTEFLGRLDRIVVFETLGEEAAERLVRHVLDDALDREGLKRHAVEVEVDDEVVAFLADAGIDERYGARSLEKTVEREVLGPLAERLARGDADGATFRVVLEEGRPCVVDASM